MSIKSVVLSVMLLATMVAIAPCRADDPSTSKPATEAMAIESKANDAFWKRDYRSAKQDVLRLLDVTGQSNERRARCLANLAICESQLDDWQAAKTHALEALSLAQPKSLTRADTLLVYARFLFIEGKFRKAEQSYESAVSIASADLGPWNADLAPFYEGLAGCSLRQGELDAAETLYKKVAQLDLIKYGPDDSHFAWSLMSLSAVEAELGHKDLAQTFRKKVFWNFRHQNELRILSEHKELQNQESFIAALRQQLYGFSGGYDNRNLAVDYCKKDVPPDVLISHSTREKNFDNWFKERIGRETAPGLAFFDPTKELKGLIVTVHGLGLSQSAFTPFAERVQHDGYGVISFDVRGFGTYRNDEVYERLDMKLIIEDMKRVLTALRADYPRTPIILLGESMGGAIVLRIAAVAPDLVDAVVSSVPSGSRYHSKSTALSVGLKLLKNKNQRFDIGTQVISQATNKADLRDMWEGDPNARLKLSPAELVNFQKFMGENTKFAQQIKHVPVIIFQGYSDNLVKPMGTLQIYQAITNKDKDMVFVGRAEHLIFEEGQFDTDIYNGALGWMNRHLPSGKEIEHAPAAAK